MGTFVSSARALFFALALWPVAANAQNIITTVAGGGSFNGPALSAVLPFPASVVVDTQGRVIIAGGDSNFIFRLDAAGQLMVVAGNGISAFSGDGGLATSASLSSPQAVTLDGSGNLFISDSGNSVVRRVDATTHFISTVAGNGTLGFSGDGGPATNAKLSFIGGIVVDRSGTLFIADTGNSVIRRVDAATQIITTVAGSNTLACSVTLGDGGPATGASLCHPSAVVLNSSSNLLFIADTDNSLIRQVDLASTSGTISTVAGSVAAACGPTPGDGGPATSASLCGPAGVTFNGSGNLVIADSSNGRIRQVAAPITSTSIITTIAGNGAFAFTGDGGPATSASFNFPQTAAFDASGNMFVADVGNNRIRKVAAPITPSGVISTVAGGGTDGDGGLATSATLAVPVQSAFDSAGNLFIADQENNRIRRVDAATQIITTVAGNGQENFRGDGGSAIMASFNAPLGVAVDRSGNIFIADTLNMRVRRVDATTGFITTVAGNGTFGFSGDGGPATSASLRSPRGLALDTLDNLYIADTNNNRIRRVDAATQIITTVAGSGAVGARGGAFAGDGGPATSARLNLPRTVALDNSGNLFIADGTNNRIRRVDAATQIITTVAGNGVAAFSGDGGPATSASLSTPNGVAVDGFGNIFITDPGNSRIRRVDATTQIISTLAGNGTFGFSGDGGPPASAILDGPGRVTVHGPGNFYVSDFGSNRIRRIQLSIQLFPASLDFGSAPPGFTSASRTVTLTNLSAASLTFGATAPIAITGTNSSDFAQSNTCPPSGASLAPGASCTVTLTFTPTAIGPRAATLTVTDSDPTSPQQVPLTGTGATAPAAVLTPSRLDFGTLAVGKSLSQTITLANPGNVTLQIFGIALSDFFNFSESDTCAAGVIAGGMCTITVTFQPTENIPFAATLTVTDNAADSPQVVSLRGTGGPGPNVSLFPQSLSFGNQLIGSTSAPQSVLVFNNGSAPLTISSIQAGPDFAVGGNCAQGIQISQGNSCSLTVNFVPTRAGSVAESIVISDNAPGSPHVVSLSGTGVAPAPVAGLSAPALNFGSQAVGATSVAQQVVVTNAGTAPLTFGVNAVAIAPAGNFAILAGSDACSTRSLAPAAICIVSVVFQPQASGLLSAMLMFADNAADSPQMVQLSGQGLAPLATLSTTSISFGVELAGTASGTQPVILGNAGTAPLTITSISISPPSGSGFTETNNCNGSVAARASCVIQVTFAPASVGGFSGNLVITDNAPGGGQQTVQLSGTAVNFSLTGLVTSAQVVAGQTVNYSMTVTPAQSFSGVVQLSCASSPSGPNCMVTPSAMSLSGAARPLTVTVQTVGRGGMGPRQKNWPPMGGFRLQVHLLWPVWLLTLALLVWLVKTHRRRVAVMTSAALLAFVLVFEVACGGGATSSTMPGGSGPSSLANLTPPGNYVIIVTASSPGSPTETFSLTLTVTP